MSGYVKLPNEIVSFLSYKGAIQNRSAGTVKEYSFEICAFFRYVLALRAGKKIESLNDFEKEDVSTIDAAFVKSVADSDIYSYLIFLASIGNKPATRARKLTSIKSFFKYHTSKSHLLEEDPSANIDSPKVKQALPKYLNLNDSIKLLESVPADDPNYARDYAILTLFLNCGIRLSELAGLNLADIDSDMEKMVVTGKGNKMRTVYLNDACRSALRSYLAVRQKKIAEAKVKIKDRNALFLSKFGRRISVKTVQWMVKKYLTDCGFGSYSTHKLRHTAATLMYNEGGVDVRTLKDILGHEQLNTTQIYTHVSDRNMADAINANPLARVKGKKKKKEGGDAGGEDSDV